MLPSRPDQLIESRHSCRSLTLLFPTAHEIARNRPYKNYFPGSFLFAETQVSGWMTIAIHTSGTQHRRFASSL
jgi:hypothetical protein